MSFKLSINELFEYQKNRLPVGIFLPLALFLGTASLVAGWPPNPLTWAIHILLACTLLIQFRMWDDLNDITNDRRDYPERVLCRAASLIPFRFILGATFAINLVLILWLNSTEAVGVFLLLNLIFVAWYQLAGKFQIHASVVYHVVLIKYPVFVLLLTSVEPTSEVRSLIYAMGAVYFCFCVYELLHDLRLRSLHHLLYLLAAEMVALELMASLILIDLRGVGLLAVIQGGLLIFGAAVLLILFNRFRNPMPMGRWSYSIFVIVFAWLLNYSIASYPSVANRTQAMIFSRCQTTSLVPIDDSCSTGNLS